MSMWPRFMEFVDEQRSLYKSKLISRWCCSCSAQRPNLLSTSAPQAGRVRTELQKENEEEE
jgi:hypothetical protein